MPFEVTTSGPNIGTITLFAQESTAAEINRVLRSAKSRAEQLAPFSGETVRESGHKSLRRGTHFINRASPRDANPSGNFGNRAPHAAIVHEGRGPISPKSSRKPMTWFVHGRLARRRGGAAGQTFPRRQPTPLSGVARGGLGFVSRHVVGGAKAQPWLVIAYNRAAGHRSGTRTISKMPESRTPLF